MVTLQDIFTFEFDRVTQERVVTGALRATGLRPGFVAKFRKHGVDLPDGIFHEPGGVPMGKLAGVRG
jgi:pilus assembly protein CpaF